MFASTNPVGQSSSSSPIGSSHSVFGQQNKPFGSPTPLGLQTGNSMYGSTSSSPAFDSSMPAFGASRSPAFGASTTPAFGQSSSAFGTNRSFGSTTSGFGGQSSAFAGSLTPIQAFGNTGGIGQSGFGGQQGGSKVTSYSAATETGGGFGQLGKLEPISAMPFYKDKSHEELRWEDYHLGNKGGPLLFAPQSIGMGGFNSSTTQTYAFSPSPILAHSSATPFSSTTFSSGFGTSAPAFSSSANGSSNTSSAFGDSCSPAFGASTNEANSGTSGQTGNNDAKKSNTRKRKIGEMKKVQKPNKSDMMFSKRKISLFNKVTELSILCKAKSALIVISPDKELYVCGYPNCDAVIQHFFTGNDTVEENEKKKQKEIVETLRFEYEVIEDKLTEELKNLKAIIDAKNKSDSIFPCWWGDSIDDMDLESLEEFKTSLQNLRLNLGSTIDEKKFMFKSNAQFNSLSNLM